MGNRLRPLFQPSAVSPRTAAKWRFAPNRVPGRAQLLRQGVRDRLVLLEVRKSEYRNGELDRISNRNTSRGADSHRASTAPSKELCASGLFYIVELSCFRHLRHGQLG